MLKGYAPYVLGGELVRHRVWVGILALIAVLYPLLRMVPSYRKTMFDIPAGCKYGEIFGLASQIDASPQHPRVTPPGFQSASLAHVLCGHAPGVPSGRC